MDLAARLKAARGALKIKQEEMVARSGIPIDTYRKYEGGTRQPGADALAGLMRAGVNVTYLLTGEGEMLQAAESEALLRRSLAVAGTQEPNGRYGAPLIDAKALGYILAGIMKTNANATPERIGELAARFYVMMVEEGNMRPDDSPNPHKEQG